MKENEILTQQAKAAGQPGNIEPTIELVSEEQAGSGCMPCKPCPPDCPPNCRPICQPVYCKPSWK